MNKLLCIPLALLLLIAPVSAEIETLIADYLYSLSPAEMVVFGAELNISNGRVNNENGERHMFGRLESAGSALRMEEPEILYERVRDECIRLLFGPWATPGNTTFQIVRRSGEALDLQTGEWHPYSGQALLVRHVTEHFGGVRYRLITLDGVMTILRRE